MTQQPEENNIQNVQRLYLGENVPKVLENFHDYSPDILQQREELIRLKRTAGNNRYVNHYKTLLPTTLPKRALSWCIGFVLSDATIQRNLSLQNTTFRLKIQQVYYNTELFDVTLELLKPYVFNIAPVNNRNTFTLDTIQHEAFNILHDIFQDPKVPVKPQGCVQKIIPSNIEDYFDPICLSSWYCGDGGKSDYTPNQGKGIEFATHGFSKECNERLAQALKNKYGWDALAVYDYTSENKIDRYYVKVAASSFNSVEKLLKPYLLETFVRKFPSPRSPKSRYLDL